MDKIIKYEIENYETFEKGFFSLVDTSIDYSDYRINPWITKADYFGKMNWGEFTIYHQTKYLLQRRVTLKIQGAIKENQLLLKINYHNFFWISIVNSILLAFFSIFIMTKLPVIYGLILLIITIFQTSWLYIFYHKTKKKFIRQIEKIIKNAA